MLPWQGIFAWSPDGTRLITSVGGIVEKRTLLFLDLPADVVKVTDLISPGLKWSANGKFITIKYADNQQYILNLGSKKIFTIPLPVDSWSPDSQHIVSSHYGRIFVQNIQNSDMIQIAQGKNPIWQPSFEIQKAAEVVDLPTPSAVSVTSALTITSTPHKGSTITPTTQSAQVSVATVFPNSAPDSTIGPLPAAMTLFGIGGIAASIVFYFIRRNVYCTSC